MIEASGKRHSYLETEVGRRRYFPAGSLRFSDMHSETNKISAIKVLQEARGLRAI